MGNAALSHVQMPPSSSLQTWSVGCSPGTLALAESCVPVESTQHVQRCNLKPWEHISSAVSAPGRHRRVDHSAPHQ